MAGKFKLTKQQEIEICDKYQNETISAENIGKLYNVSERPILAILKRHKIHRKNTYEHMGHKFTTNEIIIIINDYNNGINQNELGLRYNVSHKTIKKLLDKNNIKVRNSQDNRKIKQKDFKEIRRLYLQEYLSCSEIAKIYRVCPGAIRITLFQMNTIMRKTGEGSKLFTPIQEKEICNLYLSSFITMAEISDKYHCSPTCIKRVLLDYNIKIRKLGASLLQQNSSLGISGYYKEYSFRSMNELSFIINYLEKKNIKFINGEHTQGIKYIDEERKTERTYYPDFITDKFIFEIKPRDFWELSNVKAKKKAAIKYCNKNRLKYRLVNYPIIIKTILEKYFNHEIKFSRKGIERFTRIYKKYLIT